MLSTMANAKSVLKSLKAEEIRRQIDELEAEENALRVLLRAANRLEQQSSKKSSTSDRQGAGR